MNIKKSLSLMIKSLGILFMLCETFFKSMIFNLFMFGIHYSYLMYTITTPINFTLYKIFIIVLGLGGFYWITKDYFKLLNKNTRVDKK